MSSTGWISAFISCIAFGSFAVPVKVKRARECNVDPLVFQSYKTFMCFITSFLTIPIFKVDFNFTPYGIVSGIFWVPAGVAAIYAVQNAGLAVSQGLWSSIIVLVSFTWGIFFFHEQVRSVGMASLAVFLMIAGLWGMSFFSSGTSDDDANSSILEHDVVETMDVPPTAGEGRLEMSTRDQYEGVDSTDVFEDDDSGNSTMVKIESDFKRKRRFGLLAAVFNGVWGGSVMVPMQFAPKEASGAGFVVSFGIGASIVTLILWLLRLIHDCYLSDWDYKRAYQSLPSFHLERMWLPGGIAGLLWSIGNMASMISVKYLGEGVGYSLTQSSMLVSGLWGIFFFREVKCANTRLKWFCSAVITLIGILLLSYEHQS